MQRAANNNTRSAYDVPAYSGSVLNSEASTLALKDELDAKLKMIFGCLDVVATHPQIKGVSELAGLAEMAWGGQSLLSDVQGLTEAFYDRAQAAKGQPHE